MRILLVFLGLATAAGAAERKPFELTAKEIAEGWISLFDGETTFGWKTEGDVRVKDGLLLVGGSKKSRIECTSTLANTRIHVGASFNGSHWGEFEFEYDAGGFADSASALDDAKLATKLADCIADGPVKLAVPERTVLYIRSIKARPRELTPLFNGKDLTGWREFASTKDKKVASKFTVTKEGWLNVKDGPGDLQTEGQWADFLVQMECISNGKHLNSGLFFRCLPGLYQQGYEAQIRNEWQGNDRTKPVDFGTGAIYRRQPARKVVSTDGEWFTMTVAARGRHIATWVNGYQVTDWTDERKEADNARQGFKAGRGALSIQGHDPTTDLSFRNIRIRSWDKASALKGK